jgi:hypothetical protein
MLARLRRPVVILYHHLPLGAWRNLADAQDSGSCGGNPVEVQILSRPPLIETMSEAARGGSVTGSPSIIIMA